MSDFAPAIEIVLEHEGLYSNDPSDPGGATNYGISLMFLASLGETIGDLDKDGDVDAQDIKNMSRDQAAEIYRGQWWEKYGYGKIADQSVATKVFDMSVNMGASQAHKLVQRALGISDDGVLGPKSFDTINKAAPKTLLLGIAEEAAKFYIQVTKNRINKYGVNEGFKYLFGWIRRAYALT
jgi:lysozyme family protein